MKRLFCQLLVVLAACAPLQIHAGMIGTDQALAGAAHAERGAVSALVARSDVASALQAYGVDPAAAKARVASLTDAEVSRISGALHGAPAGGLNVIPAALVVLIIAVIIWAFRS